MNVRLLIAGALLATPLASMAVPIVGEIGMTGVVAPTCTSAASPCDYGPGPGDADGLDFGNNGAADGIFAVTFATGDFGADGLIFGDTGTISDFQYDPLSPVPVDPLWTIAGDTTLFSFALHTLSIDLETPGFLNLSGTGIISAAGFDDTMGNWTFSSDGTPGNTQFAWSSTTVASEPTVLLLLGIGLLGLAALRVKR